MGQKYESAPPPLRGEVRERVIKNHSLLKLCRYNRQNKTDAEAKMWFALRGKKLGVPFRRQQQIGQYIVDFVCLSLKLVVECDGGQHNEIVDGKRTKFLEGEGFTVLRFWNNEILSNIDGCVAKVQDVLKSCVSQQKSDDCCHPLQTSPLKGEDSRKNALKGEDLRKSTFKGEDSRKDTLKGEDSRKDTLKGEDSREDALKGEDSREDALKGEDLRKEILKGEDSKAGSLKRYKMESRKG